MIAVPLDLRVAAVLAFANQARAELGLPIVHDLVPGERLHPWACTLCRTVRLDAPAWEVEFTGLVLSAWPKARPDDPPALVLRAPIVVIDWCDRFDRGLIGDEYAQAA